jgi:hypothetical protein
MMNKMLAASAATRTAMLTRAALTDFAADYFRTWRGEG